MEGLLETLFYYDTMPCAHQSSLRPLPWVIDLLLTAKINILDINVKITFIFRSANQPCGAEKVLEQRGNVQNFDSIELNGSRYCGERRNRDATESGSAARR